MPSNFPTSFDSSDNLYFVSDGLRMRLVEDYNPGDTSITVFGEEEIMRRFHQTGIITLTEQCSEPELRALSFTYTGKTYDVDTGLGTFTGLTILDGFTDIIKPKQLTNVTQNVMSAHHNNLKDALIAIQQTAGKKGEKASRPLEGTMEARINYLRDIVLEPKAWFTVDKKVGLAPLTVTFTDQSFRLGTDGTSVSVTQIWDFGDNTSIISMISDISVISVVPSTVSNVSVIDIDGDTVTKTYNNPGVYTVTLTVQNDFGEDSVSFTNLIEARFPAPENAVVTYSVKANQILTRAGIPAGGPYTTTPQLRAPINSIIDIQTSSDPNPSNPGYSYAGEKLGPDNTPVDPINNYTWSLSDEIPHGDSPAARAAYSIGGLYDMILRVDTEFGSYRITQYEEAFDIVERYNLWLWLYSSSTPSTTRTAKVSEFGLISETFKTTYGDLSLNVNQEFLEDSISNPVYNEAQQLREFNRNTGFCQQTATPSGDGGSCVLWWASGRAAASTPLAETVRSSTFNGFTRVYSSAFSSVVRPWNWVTFASSNKIYMILGGVATSFPAYTSPTNQTKDQVTLNTMGVTSPAAVLGPTNYKNGANELQENAVAYDGSGISLQGNMSVYRATWLGDAGYFLRNEGTGQFFRIRSFYKTSGNTSEPFVDIRKLTDMGGAARTEGRLVSLTGGVYFFNNSGAVSAFNPNTGIWGTGGPGVNSAAFRSLQDTTADDFDSLSQTLLAASDGQSVAYLSFDYSRNAFIKFNEIDTTFSSVTNRPSGSQWNMGIF